jgi:DNA-binding transcriptional ArsR family regulator
VAEVSDLQTTLDALSSPIRREILWRLWDEELAAGEISTAFDLSAPTISEHLAVLRKAGLVTLRRDGTHRYYRTVQDAVRSVQGRLADEGTRWIPVQGLPAQADVAARTVHAIVASVDLCVGPETAFTAFTDAAVYSRWLGVPVQLEDHHFSCTLAWGTQVRGRYEHIVPPSLIAMRWDFDDDRIPLPGREVVGYLRIEPTRAGCRVEVHQLIDTAEQARFMQVAWTFVLGRLRAGLADALRPIA